MHETVSSCLATWSKSTLPRLLSPRPGPRASANKSCSYETTALGSHRWTNSQMNVYWVPLSKEDYVICRTFRVVVSQPLRLHLSQQLRPGAAEERFDLDKDESNHVLMKRSRHVHRLSAMVQVRRRDLFRPRWGCSYATRAARAARAGATMAQVSGGLHGEGTSRETHQGVMLTV